MAVTQASRSPARCPRSHGRPPLATPGHVSLQLSRAASRHFCRPAFKRCLRCPSLDKPSVCFQNIVCTLLSLALLPGDEEPSCRSLLEPSSPLEPLIPPARPKPNKKKHLGSASTPCLACNVHSGGHFPRWEPRS